MSTLKIAGIIALAVATAEAKKKEVPATPAPVAAPAINVIDLRTAVFVCDKDKCGVDVTGLGLISCNASGCRTMSAVVVPAGPVLRQVVVAPSK